MWFRCDCLGECTAKERANHTHIAKVTDIRNIHRRVGKALMRPVAPLAWPIARTSASAARLASKPFLALGDAAGVDLDPFNLVSSAKVEGTIMRSSPAGRKQMLRRQAAELLETLDLSEIAVLEHMVQEKRDLLHHQLADAERQRINGLGSSGADSLLFVTVSAPVVRATLPSAYTEDAEAGSPNS